jgi:HK97 family phage major capsid protein
MPKLLWQHDQTRPIGIWHDIYEDDYGLFVKGQLLLDLQQAKEAYALLKAGVIDGLSIGFRPVKTRKSAPNQDRYIDEVDLQEISLVTFAANKKAKVTAVKTVDGQIDTPTQQSFPIEEVTMTNVINETFNTMTTSLDELKSHQNERLNQLDNLIEQSTQRIEKMEISLQRPTFSQTTPSLKTKGFSDFVRKGVEDLSQKALSGQSETGGGYLVPFPVVQLINQNMSSFSVIRQLAANTVITSDSLDLLMEKTEAEAGWVSEVENRAETGTPELARVRIPVHQLYAKPRVSQKLLDDASINVDEWISKKIADKFLSVENKAFLFGEGANTPRGLLMGERCELDKEEWGKVSTLKTGVKDGLESADQLLQMVYALKSKYLAGAVWIMPRGVAFKIAKMRDNQGQNIWQRSLAASQPNTLLGYPVYLCDEMKADKGPQIVFGNIKEAYHVVDRAQMSMLRDPFSAKPYVEFYATKRVGGDIVNTDALKYMILEKVEAA